MKKKILAALCAICAFAASFTALFIPTASAKTYTGTYITYQDPYTDKENNTFTYTDSVVFNIRAQNTYNAQILLKYRYYLTLPDETRTDEVIQTNIDRLPAGQTGETSITLQVPARVYGKFKLHLTYESTPGASSLIKQTEFDPVEFTVTPPMVTYANLRSNKANNIFYESDSIVFRITATNNYTEKLYGKYSYVVKDSNGTVIDGDDTNQFEGLNVGQTITRNIPVNMPENPGTYTFELTEISGPSSNEADTAPQVFTATFTVNEIPSQAPVTYGKWKASGTHTGNIFYGSEPVVFTVNVVNNNSFPVYVRYSYQVWDEAGNEFTASSAPGDFQPVGAKNNADHTVELAATKWKYGVYKVKLTAECATSDDSNAKTTSAERYTKFSICIPLDESNGNDSFGFNQTIINADKNYLSDAEALSPLMQKAGAKWHREDVLWTGVETTAAARAEAQSQGKTLAKYNDLAKYKARLETLKNVYGIRTVCILKGTHDDYDDGGTPVSTTAQAAFADFCAYVVGELGDVVDHYEIWNEWNVSNFNPTGGSNADYAELLKASYNAIKAKQQYMNNNRPPERTEEYNFTVIGCDTAGIPYERTGRLIYDVLDYFEHHGGTYYMDAISVHCYDYITDSTKGELGFPENIVNDKVSGLKDLLTRHGLGNMDIWVTEAGFSTYTGTGSDQNEEDQDSGVTEDQQLNSMVMFNVTNKAKGWFDKVIQYQFSDRGLIKTDVRYNWGVLYNWQTDQLNQSQSNDQTTPDFIPKSSVKKAYLGLAAMNYFIGGNTEYVGPVLEDTTNRHYAYTFKNNNLNRDVTVLMAGGLDNTVDIRLHIDSPVIYIYDKYGNYLTHRESDTGYYNLKVRPEPIYLVHGQDIVVMKNSEPVMQMSELSGGDTLSIYLLGIDTSVTDQKAIVGQFVGERFLKADSQRIKSNPSLGTITVEQGATRIVVVYWDMQNLKPIVDCYEIK